MIALLAAAVLAVPNGYEVVRQLDLTGFHTRTPWSMTVLQPVGANAELGDHAARVCFSGGADGSVRCEDIVADGYVFQTVTGAAVERLSLRAGVQGVTISSQATTGPRALSRTDVWTYDAQADAFTRTSGFSHSDLGEEERFAGGDLDGLCIVADYLLGEGERRGSDHRFAMEIYLLDPKFGGYVQIFQYLSPTAYPARRAGPHAVIEAELARVRRLLAAAYPQGFDRALHNAGATAPVRGAR